MLAPKLPQGSQIDFGHPLAQGLVSCFRLQEGGGAKAFDLCRFNHGVFTSGPTWTTGLRGKAVSFSGVPWILINSPVATLPVTMLCFFESTSAGNMGVFTLADGALSNYVGIGMNGLAPYSYVKHTANVNTTGVAVSSGQWVMVGLTYDAAGTANLYQDGLLKTTSATGQVPTGMAPGANSAIGAFSGGGSTPFTGKIDLAYVWNRVLTAGEIRAISANPDVFLVRSRPALKGTVTLTGTVASHSSGEASAASGKITLTGTVASHSSGEASAASGKLTLTGTVASASAGEKSAGTETETFSGTVASHSAGEASSASGAVTVVAAVSQASSGEKSAALGSVSISASVSESSAGEHSAATGSVTISGSVASKSSGEGSAALGSVGFSGSITQDSAGENSTAISILVGVVTSISSGATESALGAVVPPVILIPKCGLVAAPGAGSACVIAAPGAASSGCVIAARNTGAAYVIPV